MGEAEIDLLLENCGDQCLEDVHGLRDAHATKVLRKARQDRVGGHEAIKGLQVKVGGELSAHQIFNLAECALVG